MRKYYLFLIKPEFKRVYQQNNVALYQTLFNLYNLKAEDCRIGISIYRQICDTFQTKIIINYLVDKYNLKNRKNKYFLLNDKEEVLIKLNRSCIVIYSTSNIPNIFKTMYLYSKNIFIVDFKNEDYFWLSKETLR